MRFAAAFLVFAAIGLSPATAAAKRSIRPRVGAAMGIVPAHGAEIDIAQGANLPVVFHGGAVMHDVTVHTVFWAPPGFHFDGAPGLLTTDYVSLIQRYFSDVAHDSGSTENAYAVLRSYPDGSGPAGYHISYSPAADSVYVNNPYPTPFAQCASPSGISTCVTDAQVQQELNRVRGGAPGGLHDVWLVFLPPNVDECTNLGACGTNTFAGYHSLANFGRGPVIYAVVIDPLIEFTPPPGSDPEGNPEAEASIDVAAHELIESITDPEGTGWMDPNGFEVGDKCDVGPVQGAPLGYALDGAPFNQVINGDRYLTQAMWSNVASGCVQRSGAVVSQPGLPTVSIRQFSSRISGNIGVAQPGVPVLIGLLRGGRLITVASAGTRSDGSWGPVSIGSHAFGDDRDLIRIVYGRGGPPPDLIDTAAGGNPFTQSGFTGWFDLDNGYRVLSHGVVIAPCSQTGVLRLTVGFLATAPPVELCQTETDLTVVPTGSIGRGTQLSLSSEDDRAVSPLAPNGALVSLTVPLGEPGSVSAVGNGQIMFDPSGFPTCSADLSAQLVRCDGLVPGAHYTVERFRGHLVRHATASGGGAVRITSLRPTGGDQIMLRNRAGRVLTVLHVARLRVDLADGRIVSGHCEAGDYFGAAPSAPPVSPFVGVPGVGGSESVCPLSGKAHGLPARGISQTDDLSGGQTSAEVPQLAGVSPSAGTALYGAFTALARVARSGPDGSTTGATVSLSITPAGSKQTVFSAQNVAGRGGVLVSGLLPGVYNARWVVHDVNGDTRTVRTLLVEEP